MNRLEKAIEKFEKAVDTSFAGPIPNSLLARQDLEAAIVVLSDRMTPLRDRITRIKGEGLAHLWNQRVALKKTTSSPLSLVNLFYGDGELPPEEDPAYVQKTAAYKYLGTTCVITGPMIASGRSYIDIEAEVAEAGLRRVIQAEEWAIFHANSSINSKAFDGLDVQITTNVIDNLGNALSVNGITITQFEKLIQMIRLQGGARVDGIFLSFQQEAKIATLLAGANNYVVALAQDFEAAKIGAPVNTYRSALGQIPMYGDFFVNPALPYPYNASGSSGSTGGSVSNVYFLRLDKDGIEMADLVPIGRTELAKVADSVRFYINEYTVLALKAEPWVGMIKNVLETIS